MKRAALLSCLALVLSGCGGGDEVAAPAPSSASPTPAASPTATQECPYKITEVKPPAGASKDLATKPVVAPTKVKAPTALQVADIVEGTGPVVETLSKIEVKYVGALYGTAKEFDSSWSRGPQETLPLQVCTAGTIVGFSVGGTGMKQGGRRQITIPAALGYGAAGQPPTIPANSALVFIIDAVKVE